MSGVLIYPYPGVLQGRFCLVEKIVSVALTPDGGIRVNGARGSYIETTNVRTDGDLSFNMWNALEESSFTVTGSVRDGKLRLDSLDCPCFWLEFDASRFGPEYVKQHLRKGMPAKDLVDVVRHMLKPEREECEQFASKKIRKLERTKNELDLGCPIGGFDSAWNVFNGYLSEYRFFQNALNYKFDWESLSSELQEAILSHTFRDEPVKRVLCLVDESGINPRVEDHTVGFMEVEGEWSSSKFYCCFDKEAVPLLRNESSHSDHWFDFRLRRKKNYLYLPNCEDDGKWVKVGRFRDTSIPKSTWNGVMQRTSESRKYNCMFFKKIEINAGCDEMNLPGYYFQVMREEKVTHDCTEAVDPYTVMFDYSA